MLKCSPGSACSAIIMDGPQKKRDTRERVVSYQEQEATASLGSALDPMGNHGRTYNPGPDMIGDLGIVVLQLICDPRQDPSATMASQLLPLGWFQTG